MAIKDTTKSFISKANVLHNNQYDYSKTEYIGSLTPVIIICHIHGEFKKTANKHLGSKQGCPDCSKQRVKDSVTMTNDEFIKQSKLLFGDKFDYSMTSIIGNSKPITIICKIHGQFETTSGTHLRSATGCPICYGNKAHNTNTFISNAKTVNNNTYDYSKVKYINQRTKVIIICRKHGEFLQRPDLHIGGKGCPICCESKGEKFIRTILENNNISFVTQAKFDNCKYKSHLKFDFFLPEHNVTIEYDGFQHFNHAPHWKTFDLNVQKQKDKIKTDFCRDNNIKLLRYNYTLQKSEIKYHLLNELRVNLD